jgi:hypothetical protein
MTSMPVEQAFSELPQDERETIISHGAVLRLSDLKKRHFLATQKIRQFEELYHTTLSHLEEEGLPDDASYALHEDYILWRHWVSVAEEVAQKILALEHIVQQGLLIRNFG